MRFVLLFLIGFAAASVPNSAWSAVEKKDRAAIFVIDTGYERTTLDKVAKAFVAPWINAQYGEVIWMLSGKWNQERIDAAWVRLFTHFRVIDYFSYVHTGGQHDHLPSAEVLRLRKENQLRLVYTTACDSEDSSEFVRDYDAAIAIGHKGYSDSTLFSLSFVRKWARGNSIRESMRKAYRRGKRILTVLGPMERRESLFTSRKEKDKILDESEMLVSYTDEHVLKEMTIDSDIPIRSSKGLLTSSAADF